MRQPVQPDPPPVSGQQNFSQSTMGEFEARNRCLVCFTRDIRTLDLQHTPLVLCDEHDEKVFEVWSKSIRDLPPPFQPDQQQPDFIEKPPVAEDLSAPPLEPSSLEKPRKA